jgi:hypothetical protein
MSGCGGREPSKSGLTSALSRAVEQRERSENGKIQIARKQAVIMQAHQKKFVSLTRGEHENWPTFFPIAVFVRTEFADFLALEPVKLQASYYF